MIRDSHISVMGARGDPGEDPLSDGSQSAKARSLYRERAIKRGAIGCARIFPGVLSAFDSLARMLWVGELPGPGI